ncbi:hypothetical protein WICPIJ_006175 [Wickerhamomyces pijperi]|uniref:Uncharacterized protein n=1 Tax=Wickerhamomyces pijperi TaxID=599730 RepID=A0A9P8TLM2_WICPI|nr:hypothetical protein WICPIJ_006175 [Wickerhamomyces pijperi]
MNLCGKQLEFSHIIHTFRFQFDLQLNKLLVKNLQQRQSFSWIDQPVWIRGIRVKNLGYLVFKMGDLNHVLQRKWNIVVGSGTTDDSTVERVESWEPKSSSNGLRDNVTRDPSPHVFTENFGRFMMVIVVHTRTV